MSVVETYYQNKKKWLLARQEDKTLSEKDKKMNQQELIRLEKFYQIKTETKEEKLARREKQREDDRPEVTVAPKPEERTKRKPQNDFYERFPSSQEELKNSEYVLTLYYSTTCGFCKKIQPALSEIKEFYEGMIGFNALNGKEEGRSDCKKYGVTGFPHLILFKHGQMIGRLKGAKPKEEIEQFIDEETSKTMSFGSIQ